MLRIYPFQERLILFLAPLFFLLMGLGLEGAYEVVAKRNKLIGLSVLVGLSILMLSNPIEGAIKGVLNPSNKEDMRQLFTILKKEALPDDTIYLYYNSVPAYLYYERILGPTLGKVVNGGNHRDTVGLYDEEISTFKGAKRFWVVLLNPFFDKNNEIEKSACKNGSLTAKYVDQDDLRLYLFDLSRVGNSDCEIIGAGNTP